MTSSYYEKIGGKVVNIDDEIPFELPDSWFWCRLGNIGDWQTGATPNRRKPEYYEGAIPWIKTGDLNNGYITEVPEAITELALAETSVKVIPSNTVIVAMYGATIGKVGITTFESTTNQACCACCNPQAVRGKYLGFSDKFLIICDEVHDGAVMPIKPSAAFRIHQIREILMQFAKVGTMAP